MDRKSEQSKINYPANRFGRFVIKEQDFDTSRITFVRAIMSNVIVTRCEYIFSSMLFEYEGLSDMFDDQTGMREPPTYIFYLDRDGELRARKPGEKEVNTGNEFEFRKWT